MAQGNPRPLDVDMGPRARKRVAHVVEGQTFSFDEANKIADCNMMLPRHIPGAEPTPPIQVLKSSELVSYVRSQEVGRG